MKFTFNEASYDFDHAHDGKEKIYFKRVIEQSPNCAFRFLDLVKIPAGADIGSHTHSTDNQEVYIIISGKGQMTVNGTTYEIKASDVILNPVGGTHSLHNTGTEEMQIVVVETDNPNYTKA